MATDKKYSALVMGGSAGSIKVIKQILGDLTFVPSVPIFIALHRLQSDKNSKLQEVIQYATPIPVIEPTHGQRIEGGKIYLAPADYHLVVTPELTFELSGSPLVHYSRPSIDVLFLSSADIFKHNLIGVLVTGANRDGALGMKAIKEQGGHTIVQDPNDSFVATMPKAAIQLSKIDHVLNSNEIASHLNRLGHLL